MNARGFLDPSQPFDESILVHCPDLIQRNLPGFAFEVNRDTSRVGSAFRRHWSDDHGVYVAVHFVGRNDKARASRAHFATLGWIESHQEHIESGGYHFQCFRSHSDAVETSGSRS